MRSFQGSRSIICCATGAVAACITIGTTIASQIPEYPTDYPGMTATISGEVIYCGSQTGVVYVTAAGTHNVSGALPALRRLRNFSEKTGAATS